MRTRAYTHMQDSVCQNLFGVDIYHAQGIYVVVFLGIYIRMSCCKYLLYVLY